MIVKKISNKIITAYIKAFTVRPGFLQYKILILSACRTRRGALTEKKWGETVSNCFYPSDIQQFIWVSHHGRQTNNISGILFFYLFLF